MKVRRRVVFALRAACLLSGANQSRRTLGLIGRRVRHLGTLSLRSENQTAKEHQQEAKEQEILIKGYQAETDRLKVVQTQMDPNQVALIAAQLVMQTLQTPDPAPMELEESSFEEADLPQPYGMETQNE